MNKYYYLIASLPPLQARLSPKDSDYEDIIYFIVSLLSENDRQLFNYLLYPADIKILVNHIAKERGLPLVHPFVLLPGTINERDISDFLRGKTKFKGFLSGFYDDYHNQLSSLEISDVEKILTERFYQSVFQAGDNFLTAYFSFDRDLKNIAIISNSRKFEFDPKEYLQGEFLSIQKFVISQEYSFIDEISSVPKDDSPQNLEKVLDKIRWKYIDQLSAFSFFDLHTLFAWFLKYQMLKRWYGEWTDDNTKEKIEAFAEHAMEAFDIKDQFSNNKKSRL